MYSRIFNSFFFRMNDIFGMVVLCEKIRFLILVGEVVIWILSFVKEGVIYIGLVFRFRVIK